LEWGAPVAFGTISGKLNCPANIGGWWLCLCNVDKAIIHAALGSGSTFPVADMLVVFRVACPLRQFWRNTEFPGYLCPIHAKATKAGNFWRNIVTLAHFNVSKKSPGASRRSVTSLLPGAFAMGLGDGVRP
jgi:hypothetical protein